MRVLGPHDLPRVAEDEPVVGLLDLVAVDEFLLEEAELVVDAVADGRESPAWRASRGSRPRGGRGRRCPGPCPPRRRAGRKIKPELAHGGDRIVVKAGVMKVALQQPSHEIFQREVVDPAHVAVVVHALRGDEALQDAVAHRHRGGNPPIANRGRAADRARGCASDGAGWPA